MKQQYFKKVALLFVFITTFSTIQIYAQCNTFVKKMCNHKITPFTENGQSNTKTLTAGEKAILNVTLFAGQVYRILVCSEEILGIVSFKVTDATGGVLFDSSKNGQLDFWDFRMKSSQTIKIEIIVPLSSYTSSVLPSGCVSIIVGFKN
jgi:hypothetical protein